MFCSKKIISQPWEVQNPPFLIQMTLTLYILRSVLFRPHVKEHNSPLVRLWHRNEWNHKKYHLMTISQIKTFLLLNLQPLFVSVSPKWQAGSLKWSRNGLTESIIFACLVKCGRWGWVITLRKWSLFGSTMMMMMMTRISMMLSAMTMMTAVVMTHWFESGWGNITPRKWSFHHLCTVYWWWFGAWMIVMEMTRGV